MLFKRRDDAEAAELLRQLSILYKQTFGTEQGRQVLLDLMDRFHILNTHKGDTFAEGQRSAILHIMNMTNLNLKSLNELAKGEDQ